MLQRFAPLAGACLIALGLMAGCEDSPTTSPVQNTVLTTESDEAYKAFEVSTESLNDFSDIVSADEVMNGSAFSAVVTPERGDTTRRPPQPPRDTTRRPPQPPRDTTNRPPVPPRDTTHRPPPPDTTHRPPQPPRDTANRPPVPPRDTARPDTNKPVKPVSYQRIISQLNLTSEQDALIRQCFSDYRDCSQSAAERYRNARMTALQAYHAKLRDVRSQLDAGTITREEARAMVGALNSAYRQEIGALEAALRSAMQQCKQEFEQCVASHLTEEQLVIWHRLLGH